MNDKTTPLPPIRRQLWNAATALAAFVFDGCKTVTAEQYAERLAICEACPHRVKNKCSLCGCGLAKKAQCRALNCPDKPPRWPAIPSENT